jgi:site-specific DNA-methyltransferase (adenine-specific)
MQDTQTFLDERITLVYGDSLDILPTLPPETLAATITDPPYIIGMASYSHSGNAKKSGHLPDMDNAAQWYALWIAEAKRLLTQRGYLALFGSWRSLPVYVRALSSCRMNATSCLIWDKSVKGPAHQAALRTSYELALFSAMPEGRIPNRSAKDIFAHPPVLPAKKRHPAEKPVGLLSHIVELVTQTGDTVLDPFMGSGSTGVACILTGRRFIGVEADAQIYADACERMREAAKAATASS